MVFLPKLVIFSRWANGKPAYLSDMQPFDINLFQQRIQQAQTPDDYQRLRNELSTYVSNLSPDEKNQFRQSFKPVWSELNGRVDNLLDEVSRIVWQVNV